MINPKPYLDLLKPYEPNIIKSRIKLDANESKPYLDFSEFKLNSINLALYPDTYQTSLINELSKIQKVDSNQMVLGNGSSELIFKLIQTYVDQDEYVLSVTPTFSMYEIYTLSLGSKFISVPLLDDFSFPTDQLIDKAKEINPKLIILCSPNNPTGISIPVLDILRVIKETNALIVLDEAYIEFSNQSSMIKDINSYFNLVILRTFSKAYGLAGVRLGYMISSYKIAKEVKKVIPPYHINSLTQEIGTYALKKWNLMESYIKNVKDERKRLCQAFDELKITYYQSDANFIFVKSDMDLYQKLLRYGILIRKFTNQGHQYYRITVGDQKENTMVIESLKEILS